MTRRHRATSLLPLLLFVLLATTACAALPPLRDVGIFLETTPEPTPEPPVPVSLNPLDWSDNVIVSIAISLAALLVLLLLTWGISSYCCRPRS